MDSTTLKGNEHARRKGLLTLNYLKNSFVFSYVLLVLETTLVQKNSLETWGFKERPLFFSS